MPLSSLWSRMQSHSHNSYFKYLGKISRNNTRLSFVIKHSENSRPCTPKLCNFQLAKKGRCQKRFSGFFPLRGGGYPPFPLSFFEHNDCPLRGGGVPPNSVKVFLAKWFSVKGVGGGYPLNWQNPLKLLKAQTLCKTRFDSQGVIKDVF